MYNPNFKNCFSLSLEKINKTLASVLKGGASLSSSVFLINYISSIPLREEHERRLSSHNEQQRKERAREKKRLDFILLFVSSKLLLKKQTLGGGEESLICFLKEVF